MRNIQEYFKQIFNIDDITSATIIITLVVFIGGILLNQTYRLFINCRQQRIHRKMFLLNLIELQIKLEKQSILINASLEKFKLDYDGYINLQRVNIPQLIIIKEFGYKLTFNAFFTGFRSYILSCTIYKKAYNKIWDSVTAIDYWQSAIIKNLDYFNENHKAYNNQRNNALQESQKMIEAYLKDNFNSENEIISNYCRDVNSIFLDWLKIPKNTRADIIHNEYVLKLRELNRKYYHYNDIPIINPLNYTLLDASLQFENLRNLHDAYRENFRLIGLLYKTHSKLIKKCIKILDYNLLRRLL